MSDRWQDLYDLFLSDEHMKPLWNDLLKLASSKKHQDEYVASCWGCAAHQMTRAAVRHLPRLAKHLGYLVDLPEENRLEILRKGHKQAAKAGDDFAKSGWLQGW